MNLRTLILVSFAFFAFSLAHAESVPGEFLVKLKKEANLAAVGMLEESLRAKIKSKISEHNVIVIQRPKVETEAYVIESLSQNPLVELVEPNLIFRTTKTPNDPDLIKLWGLANLGQVDKGNGTPGIDIDAIRAWDITQGTEDTVVAVIDTGIDYNHPDLQSNMWVNQAEKNGQPGIDDDGNGYVDDIHGFAFVDSANKTTDPLDDNGHGTHCAGTIGARGDDGKGIVGVNWKVKMMAVKFIEISGGGTLENAIKGIDYAVKNGAKILSNSWGGGQFSQLLKDAILRANNAGALFIAAAGNDGVNLDVDPHYPASYDTPNMLAVSAIDNTGRLAEFSNYGKKSAHIAAPGQNIYSSYIQLPVNNTGYKSLSGTSMATPHVAGIAALLASHEKQLNHLQIKERIISSAKKLAAIKNRVSAGGIANAYMALANEVSPEDPNDPDLWSTKPLSLSSAHPYAHNTKQDFIVEISGATQIALFFERFDVERGYDKVFFFDRANQLVGQMSGSQDLTYSPIISGDYVKIVFESDDSVFKYGFDLTKAAYR